VTELGDILARYFRVFIEDQIAQRKFNDATEVIEEALRLLEVRESRDQALQLRWATLKGSCSGPPLARSSS
jgi:putative addiction module CopG family antidote